MQSIWSLLTPAGHSQGCVVCLIPADTSRSISQGYIVYLIPADTNRSLSQGYVVYLIPADTGRSVSRDYLAYYLFVPCWHQQVNLSRLPCLSAPCWHQQVNLSRLPCLSAPCWHQQVSLSRLPSLLTPCWHQQVRLALYAGGYLKVEMVFNGQGSTRDNWFNTDRLVSSSWSDLLPADPNNFISIAGWAAGYRTVGWCYRMHGELRVRLQVHGELESEVTACMAS